MPYLLLSLYLSRKSMAQYLLMAVLLSLGSMLFMPNFDLLVFFRNTYCNLQIYPSSATIFIHVYSLAWSLCLPEMLLWIITFPLAVAVRSSSTDYPSPRNCLLHLHNALFYLSLYTYLSWVDSPTSNKHREMNGEIFMSFWSKQQVFPESWCKSSPWL